MHAPRIADLLGALTLVAMVAIIVSACGEGPTALSVGRPAFLVTVSVTPDTAHPQDSVLVQTIVRNTGDTGYKPLASVALESLTPAGGYTGFVLDVPYVAEGQVDTVKVWCQLNDWPAPDSVGVWVHITWHVDCEDILPCQRSRSAADTFVVVP